MPRPCSAVRSSCTGSRSTGSTCCSSDGPTAPATGNSAQTTDEDFGWPGSAAGGGGARVAARRAHPLHRARGWTGPWTSASTAWSSSGATAACWNSPARDSPMTRCSWPAASRAVRGPRGGPRFRRRARRAARRTRPGPDLRVDDLARPVNTTLDLKAPRARRGIPDVAISACATWAPGRWSWTAASGRRRMAPASWASSPAGRPVHDPVRSELADPAEMGASAARSSRSRARTSASPAASRASTACRPSRSGWRRSSSGARRRAPHRRGDARDDGQPRRSSAARSADLRAMTGNDLRFRFRGADLARYRCSVAAALAAGGAIRYGRQPPRRQRRRAHRRAVADPRRHAGRLPARSAAIRTITARACSINGSGTSLAESPRCGVCARCPAGLRCVR